MTRSLDSKLQDLSYRAICRNLSTMTDGEQQQLQDGLDKLPVHKVLDHVQYIENIILPQIERKNGINDQYKQFKGVMDALIWSLHITTLHDRLLHQLSNERLLCEFYREKAAFYESELLRYTTSENLLLGEAHSACNAAITKGVIRRSAQVSDRTKSATHPELQESAAESAAETNSLKDVIF